MILVFSFSWKCPTSAYPRSVLLAVTAGACFHKEWEEENKCIIIIVTSILLLLLNL